MKTSVVAGTYYGGIVPTNVSTGWMPVVVKQKIKANDRHIHCINNLRLRTMNIA